MVHLLPDQLVLRLKVNPLLIISFLHLAYIQRGVNGLAVPAESQEVLRAASLLSRDATATTSATETPPQADHKIMRCEYESSGNFLSHPHHGLHKEPDRMYSTLSWQKHKHGSKGWKGGLSDFADAVYSLSVGVWTGLGMSEKKFPSPRSREVLHQDVRLASLQKIWATVPQFFGQVLPDAHWWVSSGSLIGAMRSGGTIPWDTDGDMAVDLNETFNTKETWSKLLEFAGGEKNATWLSSWECRMHGGKCLMVTLPKEINPSGDVVFVTHPLPTTWQFFARFVDLETGYFVEIINQGQFGDAVYPLRKCAIDGTLVNVPSSPGRYLEKTAQYSPSDFLYGAQGEESIAVALDSYTCQICEDYELATKDANTATSESEKRDNFMLSLVPAEDIAGQETWVSINSADIRATRNCSRLAGAAKPHKLNLRTTCLQETAVAPLSAFAVTRK